MKEHRTTAVRRERVVLVGAMPYESHLAEEALAELERLAESAHAIVVGRLIQRRHRPDAATFIGRGKLEDLCQLCEVTDAHTVIFDVDLSPAQVRNLEEELKRKVIDRTELILDIFASRARSAEAKLEVELAQMEYTFPRLQRLWTHLDTLTGGMAGGIGGGIGTRGPGERQLETDRRLVRKRIRDLKRDLDEIGARRRRQVASRRDEVTACLVGYTNAGKSTLMNALTEAGVYVADQLFATLDTRTRTCDLGEGQKLLLSDTVGFIRHLPHNLVASFHATLEEASQADLLMHVVDASAPDADEQILAVREVLAELGLQDRSELLVYNKIDRTVDPDQLVFMHRNFGEGIAVSAVTGEGLDGLRERMRGYLLSESAVLTVGMSSANGRLQAFLSQRADVLERNYTNDRATLRVRLKRSHFSEVQRLGGDIETDETVTAADAE